MRLLIVSHTEHYLIDGAYAGWGATVREIDHLATLFDEVVHVAPLHGSNGSNKNALHYKAANVRFRPVPPSGGTSFRSKLGILFRFPIYLRVIMQELRHADVLHVRCPANIGLVALLLMIVLPKREKRWVKYAGNWFPDGSEPLSYTLQRWILKRGLHRGYVTVNGEWQQQPSHVRSFVNPCLKDLEIEHGRRRAGEKTLLNPYRLLYVGRVETRKGADRAIQAMALLRERKIDATLDVVGDGPECPAFKELANEIGLSDSVRFHGWLARDTINDLYAVSHFMLLPSSSEGWPKVLSEAMAYGVLPIAGSVSSIPYFLNRFRCGKAVSPTDIAAIADAVTHYVRNPDVWMEEMGHATSASTLFTYQAYLSAVSHLLGIEETVARELAAT